MKAEALTLLYGSVAGVSAAAIATVAEAPPGAVAGLLAGGPFAAAWLITFQANRAQAKQHRDEVQQLIAADRKERRETNEAVVEELKTIGGTLTRIETKLDERRRQP